MVRETRKERKAGESLKRAESIRKGGNCERKNLISRNQKKGQREEATKKKGGVNTSHGRREVLIPLFRPTTIS